MSHPCRRVGDIIPQSAESAAEALRARAEALFGTHGSPPAADFAAASPAEMALALHDLCVHQIELKMQNDELRRTQVALDIARARYFDLYDLAPVGYCSLSEQGLIVEANLAAASLLGVARGKLTGQPITRFMREQDADRFYLQSKTLGKTDHLQACDLRLRKDDGAEIWVSLSVSIAPGSDGLPLRCLVLSDVTARKEAEARQKLLDQLLHEKNAELQRARRVAEDANHAKSDFLSSMSHELRTPLGAILGFAQLIESGTPPPTLAQRRSIDQILKAGWYLLGLINEILDLALIESGKLSLSIEAIALPEVVYECQQMVAAQAEQRGVSVSCSGLDLPWFILADWGRLKQVLINLLANAIKYNEVGGTVTVDCVSSAPETLRCSVRNTGAGLTPEQLAQLFQPFNRLGQEAHGEEGTGIGLVICQRLTECMGGVIGVDSTLGKGCTFWIELRLAAALPAAGTIAEPLPALFAAQVDAPARTLLYIEDNPANLLLVEEIIARNPGLHLHLLSATDGLGGVALARAAQPDLILMDINLPGISGIEALKILAADPATAHIPVLALSANAMPRDIEQGLKVGFHRYLTKPINVREFIDTLAAVLQG